MGRVAATVRRRGLMSVRGWTILGVAAVLAPLLMLLAWAAVRQQGQPAGAGINTQFGEVRVQETPAADFELRLHDGGTLRLSDLEGKVVVVDFWASWCTPCRQEAALINRVYAGYSGRPVEFVGVNIWDGEDAARVFLVEFGVAYPTGADPNGDIALDYGVRGIPEKYFLDGNGVVRRKYAGPMPEDVLRSTLDALLEEVKTTR